MNPSLFKILGGLFEHVVCQTSFDVVEVIDITYVVYIATLTKGKIETNEVRRKCQDVWALSHPWAYMIKGVGDNVDRVKYIVYSLVNGRDVTMGAKSGTLETY